MQISTEQLIKYFAAFPKKEGVLQLFDKNVLPEPMGTTYANLKQYITDLPEESILPQLETLVFGASEDVVDRIVSKIKGFFLMVEYGPVRGSSPEKTGRRDGDWKLSLIVGHHINMEKIDPISESILMDKCMEYLLAIASEMERNEYLECPLHRFSNSALHFSPIEPADLYQSIGWMMDFSETIQAVV